MSEPGNGEFSTMLRVTDRNLDFIKQFVHFNPDTLPTNAVVINNGGGENQTFEQELKRARSDVQVITIDPSIRSKDAVHQLSYQKGFHILNDEQITQRISNLPNKTRTIEAYGQQMPLQADSADAIFDIHAASQWATNIDSYKDFIKESLRVLKSGGKLYIGHVFFGDPFPGDEKNEQSCLLDARNVLEAMGVNAEVFLSQERLIPGKEGKPPVVDNRICAIVTK